MHLLFVTLSLYLKIFLNHFKPHFELIFCLLHILPSISLEISHYISTEHFFLLTPLTNNVKYSLEFFLVFFFVLVTFITSLHLVLFIFIVSTYYIPFFLSSNIFFGQIYDFNIFSFILLTVLLPWILGFVIFIFWFLVIKKWGKYTCVTFYLFSFTF